MATDDLNRKTSPLLNEYKLKCKIDFSKRFPYIVSIEAPYII